ncbi:MAG: molybdenum cofactor biosynthesis protein MoaE [Myxococcota bacterium]
MPTLTILLFAGLKEAAKTDTISVDVPAEITVAELLTAVEEQIPALRGRARGCRLAIDQAFAGDDDPVGHPTELALIPPVSGGHDGPPRIKLTADALALQDVVSAVEHPGAGGLATFTGNVRRHSRGQTIEHLEYEAYGPMAIKVMTQIADAIEARIDGTRVAIHHRIGHLVVGETAVVIAASAPHRAEAFEACRAAIETLKDDVPIWKKEVADSGESWIGQGP